MSDVTLCGARHPRLAAWNTCTEAAGHDGPHVANDSCGRPEYLWRNEDHPADSYPLR